MRFPVPRRFLFGSTGGVLAALAAAMALLVILGATPSTAQVANPTVVNQYASKFLCGNISSPASASQVLAPGVYNTAINIHNPNNFDVTLQKKAVVSVQEPGQGLPGTRITEVLHPDASMEVDCSQIDSLLTNANPVCSSIGNALVPASFCKGYMITEATFPQQVGGLIRYFAAQIDVTDILTIKEEDGIWKDYTFNIHCIAGAGQCQPFQNIATGQQFRYEMPYNWPDRPVTPPCYATNPGSTTQLCNIYDVDTLIRARLNTACGGCGIPLSISTISIDVSHVNFATDSRDVTLDYEFVTPKAVRYPCYPKGSPACP